MRYKCVVSYVGDHYEGWQSQTRGTSVQEQIEKVLEKIAQTKITITASGRTDAGVNARGQVFMFDCERNMNARKWMGAINAFLPDDIHIELIMVLMMCFLESTRVSFHILWI